VAIALCGFPPCEARGVDSPDAAPAPHESSGERSIPSSLAQEASLSPAGCSRDVGSWRAARRRSGPGLEPGSEGTRPSLGLLCGCHAQS